MIPILDQEMHAVVEEPELEPCDLFVDLGLLIIEGRTRLPTKPGYGEGPHCAPPYPSAAGKGHTCNQQDGLCLQQENLRKHMLLLWKNSIPISIEVLLCPDCCSGNEKFGEATAGPEPSFVLLEQWNVQMIPRRANEVTFASRTVFQAVRSYLHFSQLSAWYSVSAGEAPKNVIYRVCVPGEAFSNKFGEPPEEHNFPMGNAGWNNIIKVSVRTLPRHDDIPRLACPLHDTAFARMIPPKGRSPVFDSGQISPSEKPVPRRRCSTTASRGLDSLSNDGGATGELMIGDSLLDPPQLLEMYPKRYQSPSRSGSPVMETPEHWMFGGRGFRGKSACNGASHEPRERGRPWKRAEPLRASLQTSASEEGSPKGTDRNRIPEAVLLEGSVERTKFKDAGHGLKSPQFGINPSRNKTPDAELHALLLERSLEKTKYKDGGHGLKSPQFSMSPEETGLVLQSLKLGLSPSDEVLDYLSHLEHKKCFKCHQNIKKTPLGLTKSRTQQKDGSSDASSTTVNCDCSVDALGRVTCNLLNAERKDSVDCTVSTCNRRSGVFLPSPLSRRDSNFPNLGDHGPNEIATVQTRLPPVNLSRLADVGVHRSGGGCAEDTKSLTGSDDNCESPICNCAELQSDASSPKGGKHGTPFLRRNTRNTDEQGHSVNRTIRSFSPQKPGEPLERLKSVLTRTCFASRGETTLQSDTSMPREVPTANDKAKFRRSLDSAACLVFHSCTGLPLTSSPAPVRKGTSFDFDSALTSVSAIKYAIFDKITPLDDEESCRHLSSSAPSTVNCNSSLLGNFEESVLNGRLEPVSTVEGFTAEIGASGTFCPRHILLPVTVFFYTLSDVEKVSSPYLTLFNPHETVVKMFVVMYDLRDMPPRCQTFLRQRTLYMPVGATDEDPEANKWLRYLIHLRFASSKSGRTYLHTDIRIVIFRKSDMDAATVHGKSAYELRSFTRGPSRPQFSPRR